jgi:hypothetical protein
MNRYRVYFEDEVFGRFAESFDTLEEAKEYYLSYSGTETCTFGALLSDDGSIDIKIIALYER